jgi:RND family efflux transporter MFP subunit
LAVAALLCACSPDQPSVPATRAVRTVEINYDNARDVSRYVGTVQSRHEVDQSFRVGGKVAQRKVDVGQLVREGDILAVLDDSDYRLAEEASQQQWSAAVEQTRQAESDRQRLTALKADGSVSAADDERAHTNAQTTRATAEAEARKLEIARNRLKYTVLRASRSGVVTAVRIEAGQVVAEGQPIISIANPDESEVVIDVPEDQLSVFKEAHFKGALASAPSESFDATLRELSPQAATQTRTYRARLKPAKALPLGATATVTAERVMSSVAVAAVPATALTQSGGQPALWTVSSEGVVDLERVAVWGYRNDEVLVTGPRAGTLVVTAGVQKMTSGLKVVFRNVAIDENDTTQQAAR